jgi:hypothetical protein
LGRADWRFAVARVAIVGQHRIIQAGSSPRVAQTTGATESDGGKLWGRTGGKDNKTMTRTEGKPG